MSNTNNEFTKKNIGDCAVWTRPDGSSQSVTITNFCADFRKSPSAKDEVRVTWYDSTIVPRSEYLPRARWNELTLFPRGCSFLAI